MKKIFLFLKRIDWFILGPIIILLCFSLVEIYSISLGQSGADLLFFRKQLAFVVVGILLYFIFLNIDYHSVYSYYNYLYSGGVLFLIAVLVF